MYKRYCFVILSILLLIALISCTEEKNITENHASNNPPVINLITVERSVVAPDEEINLSCTATDEDGDELIFEWSATTGTFPNGNLGEHVIWRASDKIGGQNIFVKVSDAKESARDTCRVLIQIGNSPNIPINPIPIDGEIDLSVEISFHWQCSDPDGDSLTYDIFLGIDSTFLPQIQNSNPTNSFQVSTRSIDIGKTFYWQVVAKDVNGNETSSPVWRFSTVSIDNMGFPCPGIPTVEHGGITYNTVQINDQCWLKENLNIGTMIGTHNEMTNNSIIEKYCYENKEQNCDKYGALYQWSEAMQYSQTAGAQGLCPEGWHIPTGSEFKQLKIAVGENGDALRNANQENESGFSALMGGVVHNGGISSSITGSAWFWTSSMNKFTEESAELMHTAATNHYISLWYYCLPTATSIRCIKD